MLCLPLLLTLLTADVTSFPSLRFHGTARAADGTPLGTIADDLQERADQLVARIKAQQSHVVDLKAQLGELSRPVGFTATLSSGDVLGLETQQVIKFDQLLHNAGGAYNPDTGLFTAPEPGTYGFHVQVTRHPWATVGCVEVGLYTGQRAVSTVSTCGASTADPRTTASASVTLRLTRGDTVCCRVGRGEGLAGGRLTALSGLRLL